MTDIQTLTQPTISDQEALHEFADVLVDRGFFAACLGGSSRDSSALLAIAECR